MGPSLRCERVNIDVASIKTEEIISFEGQDYKRHPYTYISPASQFEWQILPMQWLGLQPDLTECV